MVSGLLAAVAALVAAIFAVAAPSIDSNPDSPSAPSAVDVPAVERSVEVLRSAIRAMVDEAIASARVEEPAAALRPAEEGLKTAPSGQDGCERDEASGDGWQRTDVRCVQQSGSSSSVSVSSSSSVTVEETSD